MRVKTLMILSGLFLLSASLPIEVTSAVGNKWIVSPLAALFGVNLEPIIIGLPTGIILIVLGVLKKEEKEKQEKEK